MLDAFITGLLQVFTWPTLPLMFMGIAIGFAVGILPGLGGVVALALMLPFTYDMSPVSAFAFLLGMMAIAGTTGDITSILFGVPGESISAAMVVDGHPMAKNGEAGRALGAALMSSLIGAVVGAFLLAAAIPVVRPIVLSFGSPEFFAIALLGIVFIAAVSGGNVLKGLIAGGVGLFLSMVGLDELSGMERYTFGRLELWDGISLVAVTTGIFGLPEIIDLWRRGTGIAHNSVANVSGVREGILDAFRHWGLTLRASALGTIAGIIPGLGASLGQWLAYAHAVQSSPDRDRFGKGDVRGVLAPGAANNSSLGGGLIPTIAFGVPGNVVFAILLGAFLIQGLVPGPAMLTTHLALTFSFTWIVVITNFIAVAICFLFINQLVKITELRGSLIVPPVVVLIFLGGYVDAKSWFVMFITLAAGALGYLMERMDWPRPPLILGLVLGSLIEKNFFTAYQAYEMQFLTRPIVLIVFVIAFCIAFWPLIQRLRGRGRMQIGTTAIVPALSDALACVLIAAAVGWAIWEAQQWPFDARIFPELFGAILLFLVFILFGTIGFRVLLLPRLLGPAASWVGAGGQQSAVLAAENTVHLEAGAANPDGWSTGTIRRELIMMVWCVIFAIIISLTGFKLGGALATFLFLIFIARESWLIVGSLTVGTYIFFVLTGDLLNLAKLSPGLIVDWLGINSIEGSIIDFLKRVITR